MKGLNLAEWAIRHKQIVYFFIIAIITGGLWSYFHLGRSEDPDLQSDRPWLPLRGRALRRSRSRSR